MGDTLTSPAAYGPLLAEIKAVAPIESPEKVPQAVALFPPELLMSMPWGHHAELMIRVKEPVTRQWYMRAAVECGWSRNILVMQVEPARSIPSPNPESPPHPRPAAAALSGQIDVEAIPQ